MAAAQPHSPYKTLYVFGDSYSDIGEGYLDGDGPTAVAYFAQAMGLKLLPANDATVGTNSSLDFAVSGAQTGAGEGHREGGALLGFGMKNQVAQFSKMVNAHTIAFQPQTALFFLAGGLNDRQLPTDTTVANLESEIQTLYELGARHFEVALLPTEIPSFSEVGKRLNPALADIPSQMMAKLPQSQISISHWGIFFNEVMEKPAEYGIQNTTDKCAGRAIRNEDAKPCASPGSYFYYHSGHPSTAVHKTVGGKMYRELLEQLRQ